MHSPRDQIDAPVGAHPASAHWWTATGHERPVFLDEHGRRRRWVLAGGMLAGVLAALWLTALVVGAIGFATLPAIGVHSIGAQHGQRVRRQPDLLALRATRDSNARRGQAEARVAVSSGRVPAVLKLTELPSVRRS
jgi:hypothetical protein